MLAARDTPGDWEGGKGRRKKKREGCLNRTDLAKKNQGSKFKKKNGSGKGRERRVDR
jgi:hypothetical protein